MDIDGPVVTAEEIAQVFDAVRYGDTNSLESQLQMISNRRDIRISTLLMFCHDKHGKTIVHHAAKRGRVDILVWLSMTPVIDSPTARKLLLLQVSNRGDSPMIYAAKHGKTLFIKALHLQYGCPVSKPNHAGISPVLMATKYNHTDTAKEIFKLASYAEHPSVNHTPDNKGITPVHLAAGNDNLVLTRFLLANGANPKATAASGMTPLHYAAEIDSRPIAKLLVDAGADFWEKRDVWGRTPIAIALLQGVFVGEDMKTTRGCLTEFWERMF